MGVVMENPKEGTKKRGVRVPQRATRRNRSEKPHGASETFKLKACLLYRL